MPKYYNTTKLKNVKPLLRKTESQDKIIYQLFLDTKSGLSPWMISSMLIRHIPITSIRRSLNTLEREEKIERTDDKRTGDYGRPEFIYKLK